MRPPIRFAVHPVAVRSVAAAGLFLVVVALAIPGRELLSANGLREIAVGAGILGLLAVGQAVVVLTRNVDLSSVAVLGLSAAVTTGLLAGVERLPVGVAAGAGIAVGAVCGVVNGALAVTGRAPTAVITLGTLFAFRGIAGVVERARQPAGVPGGPAEFGTMRLLGIPYAAWAALAALAVVIGWLRYLRSGRDLYVIGIDPVAARRAGIRSGPRLLGAYTASGALAGIAGVFAASLAGGAAGGAAVGVAPPAGGMELVVLAAVVIGGGSVVGGSGSPAGALAAAVLLSALGVAIRDLGMQPAWWHLVAGVLLLVGIGAERWAAERVATARRAPVAAVRRPIPIPEPSTHLADLLSTDPVAPLEPPAAESPATRERRQSAPALHARSAARSLSRSATDTTTPIPLVLPAPPAIPVAPTGQGSPPAPRGAT